MAAARFDGTLAKVLGQRLLSKMAKRREADADCDRDAKQHDKEQRPPIDAGRGKARQLNGTQGEQRVSRPK